MTVFIQIAILIIGFVLLVKGADFFVDGAAGLAKRMGIPELVVGLTIVAMGTSAPEAAVSITAAFKENADIAIGNVIGSNILNIFVILGLAALIIPIAVSNSTIKYELPFMVLITGIFLALGYDGVISRPDGAVLWLAFLIYLGYLFIMTRNSEQPKESEGITIPKALLLTLIGLLMIIFGSDKTVDAASEIAKILGMSERFIGLTIVALGTSLPELVTSVTAAHKGSADIAIGNIVGSNVFNVLFVLGTSALIIPINFMPVFRLDAVVAIAASILLLVCCLNRRLGRRSGAILLTCYILYFFFIVLGIGAKPPVL
ncbi:MAG: calcium/sodium antiporter [Clostridia bacterium]|nr:calcium/sodium antiporter [Clostridia bacterium]